MEEPIVHSTLSTNPPYAWIGEPKQRTSFGILSLCVLTLVICAWNTVHFNIPRRRYSDTRRFFLQVAWIVFALLAPEVLLYLAINERTDANFLLRKALEFHPDLAKPGMLARMRSYIRGLVRPNDRSYGPTPRPYFSRVHAFYAIMGGVAFYKSDGDDTLTVNESRFELSTNPNFTVDVPGIEALTYIMKHFPHIITDIPEDTILDRARYNGLSTTLLIFQVAWFCTNCASGLIQRFPLSLFEVSTVARGLCTLLAYFVWWSKPLNVAVPTMMRGKEARKVHALLTCRDREYDEALKVARKMAGGDSSTTTEGNKKEKITLAANALQSLLPHPERPPRFHDPPSTMIPGSVSVTSGVSRGERYELTAVAVSPILYGLIHLLTWSNRFPTPLEHVLWLVSSIVITCSGAMTVLVAFVAKKFPEPSGQSFRCPLRIMALILIFIGFMIPLAHIIASGFLLVESLRQLFLLEHVY